VTPRRAGVRGHALGSRWSAVHVTPNISKVDRMTTCPDRRTKIVERCSRCSSVVPQPAEFVKPEMLLHDVIGEAPESVWRANRIKGQGRLSEGKRGHL
jgi:hypothetical protein